MKTDDIYSVTKSFIEKMHFKCAWQVVYLEQYSMVEIKLQFNLPNPSEDYYEDVRGNLLKHNPVLYQVSILIYQANIPMSNQENYLVCFPVKREEGMEFGKLYAIIKYLKNISSSVPIQWEEFKADGQSKDFKVEWDQAVLDHMVQNLKERQRYSKTRLHFVSQTMDNLRSQGVIV